LGENWGGPTLRSSQGKNLKKELKKKPRGKRCQRADQQGKGKRLKKAKKRAQQPWGVLGTKTKVGEKPKKQGLTYEAFLEGGGAGRQKTVPKQNMGKKGKNHKGKKTGLAALQKKKTKGHNDIPGKLCKTVSGQKTKRGKEGKGTKGTTFVQREGVGTHKKPSMVAMLVVS